MTDMIKRLLGRADEGIAKEAALSLPKKRMSRKPNAPMRPGSVSVDGGRISGEPPLTLQELKDILERESDGIAYPIKMDRKGVHGTTPVNARTALYRRIFKRELGDRYNQGEADAAARNDMANANKRRHENLVAERFSVPKRFDPDTLYAVPPHRTSVFPPNPNLSFTPSFGKVDSFIPFTMVVPRNEQDLRLGSLTPRMTRYRPGIKSNGSSARISLNNVNKQTGRFVVDHEGIHSFANSVYPTGVKGWATFRGNEDALVNGRKGKGYAIDPSEFLVGLAAEKVRLRANGHHESKGLGRILAKDVIDNWGRLGKYTKEDMDLNVYSLRHIIKELYDKANSKGATEKDKSNYQDLLDRLDYDSEMVQNGKGSHGWPRFAKNAMSGGEVIGGATGALTGGILAAVLSSVRDGKDNGKKKSFARRLLRGILWSGAGALGGGLAGLGIARMIGSQVRYSRNLSAAKNIASRQGPSGKGRVLYLNFPENKFEAEDGTALKKVFPEGVPVQHGALVTMNEDGSNARLFQIGGVGIFGEGDKGWGKFLVEKGLKDDDKDLVRIGSNLMSGKSAYANLSTGDLGDVLKGKSDEDIARTLADYGKRFNLGNIVEISEGKKGVDRRIPEEFMKFDARSFNESGMGYGVLPGGLNCGTSARRAFDTVNGNMSHLLDYLAGGLPSLNAPSIARKWVGKSHEVEGREDMIPQGFKGWTSMVPGKPKVK